MKYILILMFLMCACDSPYFKIAEDIVIGEADVIEKVAEDSAGIPHRRPHVKLMPNQF